VKYLASLANPYVHWVQDAMHALERRLHRQLEALRLLDELDVLEVVNGRS
jgi:hypothetical protein